MLKATDYIPVGHENGITRSELRDLTGFSDREIREQIRLESLNGELIINLQDGKGYFKPGDDVESVRAWMRITMSRMEEEEKKLLKARRYLLDEQGKALSRR